MLVEFWSRTPGDHTPLKTVNMSSVPRLDERVTIDGEVVGAVHSVCYDVSDSRKVVARVLVRV